MQCPVCGLEVADDDGICPHCQANLDRVHILSSEERENFRGMTIESDTSGKSGSYSQKDDANGGSSRGWRRAPFPRVWIFNSILAGIIGMLFLAVIILFITVFASPLGVLVVAILVFTWLLRRSRF